MPTPERHTCKNCRYSFPLDNKTEYRCIRSKKVYTLDTIKLRLCSNWKEPRKAGEKDDGEKKKKTDG